jgi:hypothetical protein
VYKRRPNENWTLVSLHKRCLVKISAKMVLERKIFFDMFVSDNTPTCLPVI